MSASNHAGSSSGPGSAAASDVGDHVHSPNSSYDQAGDDRKLSRGTGKRNRVHFACTECYRRKQKCNRETPCQHCIARKVPDRCRTFQPGEDANDVGSRLSRLEKMLEDYLPALMNRVEVAISASHVPGGGHALPPSVHDQPPYRAARGYVANAATLTESPLALHAGPVVGKHALARGAGPAPSSGRAYAANLGAESDEDPTADHDSLSPKTGMFIGGGAMDMHLGTLLGRLPGKKPSPAFREPIRTIEGEPDLDEIMSEYGATMGGSAEILAALPERALCNKLLDHFYQQINWIRQPLSRKRFRDEFDKFWDDGPKLTAQNINVFAILCCLCAMSCLSIEDPNLPTWAHNRLLAARRYHFAARKALHLSTTMGREDLYHVIGACLSCRFMLLDRRIGEAYTSNGVLVRAAYTIGLHRDGTKLGLGLAETEERRRVWASVYFLDRLLSVTTGRPPAIDDRISDTLPPTLSIEDDIYPMPANPPRMPDGVEQPTPMLYAFYRHRIALIEGRILTGLQSLDSTLHVSDVLALDREIRALQDGLPFYLRAKRTAAGIECDQSLDVAYGFLAVQRFLVHTEISAVRIALHRPFLLRSSSNPKYLPCREACLDAALHDIELRNHTVQTLKDTASHELHQTLRVHIGTFKWFHSLLVCGVVLLMQPDASNAGQLRAHLQQYVSIHYGKPCHQADEMRTREAHVIELFLGKLDELDKQRAENGGKAAVTASASRKRSKKNVAIDEASKRQRARSPATSRTPAAARKANKEGRGSSHSSLGGRARDGGSAAQAIEADGDEHATADLLLGFGQQARHSQQGFRDATRANSRDFDRADAGPGGGSRPIAPSRSYLELSGSRNSLSSPHKASSGDWPRGYPGVGSGGNGGGGGGRSCTNSPLGTPGTDLLGGSGSAIESPITTAGGSGRASGGNSDEAQTIFDTWYRAEFAVASMPTYEVSSSQVGSGAMPYGLGVQVSQAAGGGSMYGLQGQQPQLQQIGSSTPQQPGGGMATSAGWDMDMGGLGRGMSGRAPPSGFPTLNQGIRGGGRSTNNGFVNPSSSTSTPAAYPVLTNASGAGAGPQGSGMANFGMMTGVGSGLPAPPTYGGGVGAGGVGWPPSTTSDQSNPGFDPAFWQTLIDKIAS